MGKHPQSTYTYQKFIELIKKGTTVIEDVRSPTLADICNRNNIPFHKTPSIQKRSSNRRKFIVEEWEYKLGYEVIL